MRQREIKQKEYYINKIIPLFLLSLLAITLSTFFVSGVNSVNFNTPNSTNIIGGSAFILNATLDTNTNNLTIMRFYYRNNSDSGAWTLINSVTNTSAQQTHYQLSWDTTTFWDDMNIELNVTGENVTGVVTTVDNVWNVSIDNGVPTASFASNNAQQFQSFQSSQPLTLGLAADNSRGIANCTIRMNNGRNVTSSNGVNRGDSCFNGTVMASDFSITTAGEYTYTILAYDDNSNSTASSSRQLTIYFPGSGSSGGGGASSNTVKEPIPGTEVVEAVRTAQEQREETGVRGIGQKVSSIAKSIGNGIGNVFKGIGDFFKGLFRRNP
ncbi:MAG: hypothetical protein AABY22_03795 [Nanoarchaeota archaeon]